MTSFSFCVSLKYFQFIFIYMVGFYSWKQFKNKTRVNLVLFNRSSMSERKFGKILVSRVSWSVSETVRGVKIGLAFSGFSSRWHRLGYRPRLDQLKPHFLHNSGLLKSVFCGFLLIRLNWQEFPQQGRSPWNEHIDVSYGRSWRLGIIAEHVQS